MGRVSSMNDDDLRDKLIGVLGENQVTTFTDTDGQRSMRLTKPDEQADALMPVVRAALAQAWEVDELRAMVDRVRALAKLWHQRGEHDMKLSKTLPEDIQEVIYLNGCEMVESARHIRNAIDDRQDHEFVGVAAHPDDDECTHRSDGTDATYCGRTQDEHSALDGSGEQHDPWGGANLAQCGDPDCRCAGDQP